ncbi:MAG: hypothetical protein KIT68_13215, partial [Phycisphaeraceae bacterium]|nr:hypothetical protein [Phycisphaeraceae bacterium]
MSAGPENPSRSSGPATGRRAEPARPAPTPTLKLTARLADVPGIGEARARALAELGLRNVGQLIAHVPMRYERLEAERPIAECTHDALVATRGEIVTVGPMTRGRGRSGSRFKAVLMDGAARMDLLWFNMPYVRDRLHPGVRVRVQGKATRNGPTLQMVNPLLQVIRPNAPEPIELDERVRPVYPAGAPAASWQIEQAVGKVLDAALPAIEDHLPESFRSARNMPSLADAYRMVHRPAHLDEALAGRRRLAYDELLLLQVALGTARAHRLASFLSP